MNSNEISLTEPDAKLATLDTPFLTKNITDVESEHTQKIGDRSLNSSSDVTNRNIEAYYSQNADKENMGSVQFNHVNNAYKQAFEAQQTHQKSKNILQSRPGMSIRYKPIEASAKKVSQYYENTTKKPQPIPQYLIAKQIIQNMDTPKDSEQTTL